MHPFESQLSAQLQAHDWQRVTSAVAVSGGADSIALLRALAAVQLADSRPLVVLHFNHKLRGEPSDRDAQLVEHVARNMRLDCLIGQANSGEIQAQGDSLEAAARDARYAFFTKTCSQIGARYLFTAHTADDQAETVLHRVIRGTGVDGLAGIPRVRPLSALTTIVRPMLDFKRREVIDYLQAIGQSYRDDETNTDTSFTRNRIRHEVLPALARDYNPQVYDALLRLAELSREASECIEEQVAVLEQQCVLPRSDEGVLIRLPELRFRHPYLIRQLFMRLWQRLRWPLQAMTFDKWQQLAELALSTTDSSLNLPGNVRAKKQGEQLMLSRPAVN